jgi:hypothetical protein
MLHALHFGEQPEVSEKGDILSAILSWSIHIDLMTQLNFYARGEIVA